jgi:hypothetical protein
LEEEKKRIAEEVKKAEDLRIASEKLELERKNKRSFKPRLIHSKQNMKDFVRMAIYTK